MKNRISTQPISHTLDSVYDEKSRILVLGTMPSVASRKYGFYYGHKQNRFWPTLAAVFGEPYPETIDDKKALVLCYHIALWDVLARCTIKGSDDASIKDAVPNDIAGLLAKTNISAIYCTGKKAYSLYTKLVLPSTGIEAVYLPSTSPANRARWPDEKLIAAYCILKNP